ncbi:MAG: type II toxin-antitoxin system death-on-curing family toxin [Chloroflexota bacterium]|nr:type II toxin-antitoxin system death-on-curing family toxin [Chloroflexota bacterium]
MTRLHYIDEPEVSGIVGWLTRDLFPGTPAFRLAGDEGAARLDSALAQPRSPYYRTAQRKAAALHYSLNKNHPFVDGNKRLAATATEWFLLRNHFVLLTNNDRIVEFSLQVADNRLSREASTVWIEKRAFRLTWDERRMNRWFRSLTADERLETMGALDDPDAPHQKLIASAGSLIKVMNEQAESGSGLPA